MKIKVNILLTFLSISLIPLIIIYYNNNFRMIIFHDSPYPLNSKELTHLFFHIWRDNMNFGYADVTGIPLIIFYLFIYIFETVTFNKVLAQILLLFILNLLTLYSAYVVAKDIGLNDLRALLASFLYSFNPYSLYYCWRILNVNIFLYSVFPLYIFAVNKIHRDRKYKYALLIVISTAIAYPAFTNPGFLLSLLAALVVYALALSILLKRSINEIFMTLVLILLPILILIFPVYINLYFVIKDNTIFTTDILPNALKIYYSNTRNVNFLNLFTLTAMPPVYENVDWYPFQELYKVNVLTIVLGLFIVFILTLSLITQKTHSFYNILPFITLFLFASLFIFNNIFGYFIFSKFINFLTPWREPYHKLGFIIALCLSLIIPKTVQLLATTFEKNNYLKFVIYFIITSLLVFYSFPFFTLNFIPKSLIYENTNVTPFTPVVYDYANVVEVLNNDHTYDFKKDRILVYPITNVLWCENGYVGNDILRLYGFNTISTFHHTNSKTIVNFMANILENITIIKNDNFTDILSKLGVRYILIRKQPCQHDLANLVTEIKTALENKNDVLKLLDTERFVLFKIKRETSRFAILASTESTNLTILDALSMSRVIIASKVDPSTWEINISSNTPFLLIFTNGYDPHWEAYVYKNGTLIKTVKPIPFYDVFNAFWIDETGVLHIVIRYKLQQFFVLFLSISIVFFCIYLFYILCKK